MRSLADTATGIGLRQPHYREVFSSPPALGFVEVHSENFFGDGGAALHALERARSLYEVSLHGVGLSLGSTSALAQAHLERLARLVERTAPVLVSEHLSWGGIDGRHFNDLLPLPHTREALDVVAERVERVQERLARTILVENVSAYVEFRHDEMTDTAFLAELARRTGCKILLDLNNLHVNAINFGFDAAARLADLPAAAIGEIHLAGHAVTPDCLIDTHGARVAPAVWALYEAACRRFGPRPTLIEWDTDLPPLSVLLDEAAHAAAIAAAVRETAHA